MLVGLIGAPSKGKSTFFKASTLAEVEINARPFTTVKSSEGEAYIKIDCIETEFNTKCQPRHGFCLNSKRFVPFKLMDVPGLIKGAHLGKGMGNTFLDDLNEADALIQVIDISGTTNEEGNQTTNYDPSEDIKFIEAELDQWYLRVLKKGWDKFARTVKQEHQDIAKSLAKQLSGLRVTENNVETSIKELNLLHQPTEWSEDDLLKLAASLRKKTKPLIIAANKIDIPGGKENYEKIKEEFKDYKIIPCSAESELALREAAKKELISYIPGENSFEILEKDNLSEKQIQALSFIKKNVLDKYNSTGIQDVLDFAILNLLKYIAIFPGGVNSLVDKSGNCLPDCFLLPENSTPLDFAYKIHKDLGDKFIKAMNVKKKIPIGKDNKLNHRDVVEIISDK